MQFAVVSQGECEGWRDTTSHHLAIFSPLWAQTLYTFTLIQVCIRCVACTLGGDAKQLGPEQAKWRRSRGKLFKSNAIAWKVRGDVIF